MTDPGRHPDRLKGRCLAPQPLPWPLCARVTLAVTRPQPLTSPRVGAGPGRCVKPPSPPPVPGTPLPCDRKLRVCRTKDIFQSTWKDVYFGSSLVSSRQFAKLMTTAAGLPLKKSRFPSGRAWLLGTSGSGGCGAAHPGSGGSRWARCRPECRADSRRGGGGGLGLQGVGTETWSPTASTVALHGTGGGFRSPRTPRTGRAHCPGRGAVSGRSDWLQRLGGTAHLVAEEAGTAARGGGGARRRGAREAAHVPEAQRAVVRGRVEHLFVHLRAQGGAWDGAAEGPPPGRPPFRGARSSASSAQTAPT